MKAKYDKIEVHKKAHRHLMFLTGLALRRVGSITQVLL